MIKPDIWIEHQSLTNGMISPFESSQVSKGNISYGLSSYGYDIRIGYSFKLFNPLSNVWVDPKDFNDSATTSVEVDKYVVIPPHSFALGTSVERFRIPRNVLTLCVGKSTYARCGIIVNVTPFEPEWEGEATIEISNTTPLPAKIYAGEGIAQVLFFESDLPCSVSYADRKGKYQGQKGVTVAKVN